MGLGQAFPQVEAGKTCQALSVESTKIKVQFFLLVHLMMSHCMCMADSVANAVVAQQRGAGLLDVIATGVVCLDLNLHQSLRIREITQGDTRASGERPAAWTTVSPSNRPAWCTSGATSISLRKRTKQNFPFKSTLEQPHTVSGVT